MRSAFRLRAPIVLPCDPACSVLRDAVVDVEADGRLGYCGPAGGAPADPRPVRECTGMLLPGLVNTHAHSPMTVLRGMGGDLPLLRWLREVIWPAEARMTDTDAYAGMALGAVELLRTGVTTSVEQYFHGESVVAAVLDSGLRTVFGSAIVDMPGLDWREQLAATSAWIDADGLRSGPDERVELAYGPHSAYTLPPDALRLVAEAARERDALVTVHVAESPDEDAKQRAEFGSVPALLERFGVLGGRVLAAHSVHLSDVDIETFARHQVGVAHCPTSNAKLACGIARLNDLRTAGVPVGLGTDGPASYDGLDLWAELRMAGHLARLSTMDSTALGAAEALLTATRGGADALRRNDIGVLERGRWADVVQVGMDEPAFAAGVDVPDEQLLANLVWAAGSRAVRDVWVAGDQVIDAGEPTRVDRDKAQAAAGAVTRRLLS